MKRFKKFTAEVLILILIIPTIAICLSAFSDSVYKTGDIIEFGSYPQSLVNDESITSALDSCISDDDFVSFGYYSGNGTKGSETSSDFMLYADTVYQGVKYRGIKIIEKRPWYTYKATGSYRSMQSGYTLGTTYWFRYDPIEWIVLDANNGLVMSKAALDAQPFNNTTSTADSDGYNSYYSSSSLYDFINKTFTETAFNGNTSIFDISKGNSIFIPTKDIILNTAYGFSTDSETVTSSAYADITDYDIAIGAIGGNIEDRNVVPYWLDSVYDETFDYNVSYTSTIQKSEVYMTLGIRVAAYVDIDSIANTYTLSYYSDGECIKRDTIHEGDTITDYVPSKDHYGFTGWDYEIPDTMPAYDITVNANWKINSNKLTINANEGSFKDGTDLKEYTVNYDEDLTSYMENPSRQGYVFSGWDSTVPGLMPDNELTLNATWTEAEDTPYVINIYKEKSTGNNNGVKEYDIEVINKTGKTNSNAIYEPEELSYFNFDTDRSNVNEVIKADGSTVLNAYYTRKTGIITFNFGEGYQSINQEYKYGQQITFPDIPERDGYAGTWDNTADIFDGSITKFTVIWNAGEYSITFDTDGGSNINTIVAECDSPITEPDAPVKEGYTFVGWDKEFPEKMPAGGLELKAIWERNSYTVSYVVNGETTEVSVLFGDEIPSQETPLVDGYTFTGWSPELPEYMPANNITVNALFDQNEYTITWNYDGKTEYSKVKFGEEITPFENAAKKGFRFIGWDKEIPETMPSEDLEFNAVFEICEYTITFVTNNETIAEYTLKYGDTVKAPTPAEQTGYTFVRWDNLPETMPDCDVTSTSVYSKNTYNLTYKYGDNTKTYEVGYHEVLPIPENLEITGYKFIGWDNEIPKSMPANDLTFTAIYESAPVISISGCRNRTEKYMTTITFHANYTNCSPENIVWYNGNGNVIGTGESITVSQAKSSYTVQAKVVINGNVVASSDTENVKIKNGFFDKLISFFGRLFVPDKFKIDQR